MFHGFGQIEFVTVKLPFLHAFGTSVHVWTCKEALLLRLEAEGVTAWGECVADPDPFYLPETTTTARHIIEGFLLPLLEPGLPLGELLEKFRAVRGHSMAKATVENALIALLALRKGVPVHQLLGFPTPANHVRHQHRPEESPDELIDGRAGGRGQALSPREDEVEKGRDIEYGAGGARAIPRPAADGGCQRRLHAR